MLTVAAVFSQERLNVYYEDDSVIFCSSDYIDTYLIAAALNKEFDNVNIRAKPWRAAKKYFLNYSDHEFVKNLDKYTGYTDNSWSNFNVIWPLMNYGFYGDSNKIPNDKVKTNAFGSKKKFQTFLLALEKFYKDTNAAEFFNSMQEYNEQFQQGVDLYTENGKIHNYFESMEKYLGTDNLQNKMDNVKYVIFSSLFREDYGASFITSSNETNNLLIGFNHPMSWNTGKIDVDFVVANSIHEFFHNYINRYVQARSSMIEGLAKKKDKKDFGGYGPYATMPWFRLVDENMVRAVETRIYADIFGDDQQAYDYILKEQVERNNFASSLRMYNVLPEYEQNRDKYPSLDLYMDPLIKALFTE